jgi:hypothetical protein
MKMLCIATKVQLTCKNTRCGYIHYSKPPAQASIGIEGAMSRERSTDYAVNVLWVLGFLSVGDGCTEATRLLGFLGLPNDTTMESRSFTIIEDRLSPYIAKLTDAVLHENLSEEVRRSTTPNNFELWRQAQLGLLELDRDKYPTIRAGYDMAWQQQNSGNKYSSASGHALFMGGLTRKPVSLVIKSKICNVCSAWQKKDKNKPDAGPPPPHTCWKNHEGSSGSMEPQACLEMTIDLFEKKQCCLGLVCIDDDASTRSMLKWSNEDWMKNNNTTEKPTIVISKGPNKGKQQPRPNKGRLPGHIPEPIFYWRATRAPEAACCQETDAQQE